MNIGDTFDIEKDLLIDILWGVCLSDNFGDVMYEMTKLSKLLGIDEEHSQESLLAKMKEMDLIPEYQRKD